MKIAQRVVAEGIGTAMLLATVVGSGIMAERLAGGNVAIALLANAIATAGGLVALILSFGPISGAHFNPVVTLSLAASKRLPWASVAPYIMSQAGGAILGVWAAHLMFGEPVWQLAAKARPGFAMFWSEIVATFGLLMVILSGVRHRSGAIPYAVAAYIAAAYWFTASTSFANPAVTLARALSDTFAGIRFADVPGFIVAQLIGAAAAVALDRFLHTSPAEMKDAVHE